jgi:hypothetical protein
LRRSINRLSIGGGLANRPEHGVVGSVQGEFVHAPWSVLGLRDEFAGKSRRGAIDILSIEVKPERIAPGHEPSFDSPVEMEMAAKSVGEHPVVVQTAGIEGEIEALEEGFRRIEIIARQNCG